MPWNRVELKDWNIVGMNHYFGNGRRQLFVAMTHGSMCIKAEGRDEAEVFNDLARQAVSFMRSAP